MDVELVRFGLGQVEDIVDDVQQMTAALFDDGERASIFLRLFALDQVRETQDRGERRPEFMTDVSDEVILGATGRLGGVACLFECHLHALAFVDVGE